MRTETDQTRPTALRRRPGNGWGRPLAAVAAGALVLSLTACTQSPEPTPQEPPAAANLYLNLHSVSGGLHVVNTATGAATRVGTGGVGTSNEGSGLSPSAAPGRFFGADVYDLYLIAQDGSGQTRVSAGGALTEGLAYDLEKNVLYASSNGFLHVLSPATGETLETWMRPPNTPDIEGLAFDPETRTLFGLARGFSTHPDAWNQLYALAVDDPIDDWQAVGPTGGLWEHAGLAFDLDERVLYAVGRQGDIGGLYRIDPATGATTRVGSTGLARAVGGLAWVP